MCVSHPSLQMSFPVPSLYSHPPFSLLICPPTHLSLFLPSIHHHLILRLYLLLNFHNSLTPLCRYCSHPRATSWTGFRKLNAKFIRTAFEHIHSLSSFRSAHAVRWNAWLKVINAKSSLQHSRISFILIPDSFLISIWVLLLFSFRAVCLWAPSVPLLMLQPCRVHCCFHVLVDINTNIRETWADRLDIHIEMKSCQRVLWFICLNAHLKRWTYFLRSIVSTFLYDCLIHSHLLCVNVWLTPASDWLFPRLD